MSRLFLAVPSAAVLLWGTAVYAADMPPQTADLPHQQIGMAPHGFAFWRDGRVDLAHWTVVRDSGAIDGVAIQRAGTDRAPHPALAVYMPLSVTNLRVRTRFKLAGGAMPSVGIAVRITSPDDYDLVRASAYEARLSLLHMVHGAAEEIAGVDADIAQDHWQTLDVVAAGEGFRISLDGRWALTAFDHRPAVAGQVGLWTERNDTTRFDGIEVTPLAEPNSNGRSMASW